MVTVHTFFRLPSFALSGLSNQAIHLEDSVAATHHKLNIKYKINNEKLKKTEEKK